MNAALKSGLLVVLSAGLCGFVFLSGRKTEEKGNMAKLVGVDFEVFGRVQGVFFRKYTQKKAEELSLKGWCMNTDQSTVTGRVEGEKSKVEMMKDWLRKTGSPQSAIDKAEFKNEQEITEISFPNFSIRR
ncbi:acylphosphatase-2 [Diachasma alloeum]|uniref:acylphosphatase-2 n=1 Tax=Diachasma alloeum TaxID=454923 RepID=UPI00073845EC|nr:acylphosphatase-2 [Diachasma alloeum]